MGKIIESIHSSTERISDAYQDTAVSRGLNVVSSTAGDALELAGDVTVLSLSKKWIGISTVNAAKSFLQKDSASPAVVTAVESTSSPRLDRGDSSKLYSLKIGDYFMPLSQTFQLSAEKKLNVSALVDGPDIIQQTRKGAKTIDVSLRLSLRDNQPNLQIVKSNSEKEQIYADAEAKVTKLAEFLDEFYEQNAVLLVQNDTVNDTFGVVYAIITKYRFIPRVGMGTYTFEFSLMEVLYGENVVTFNLREIGADIGD